MNTKPRLVVVGGGTAGASVVRRLSSKLDPSKFEMLLITAHSTHVYLPAMIRLLVRENAPLDTVLMPYNKIFGSFPGTLKIGTVKTIYNSKGSKGRYVILTDDTRVSYDILFIATGSHWEELFSFPTDEQGFEEHVNTWRERIKNAENIVIAGGGAVGIEIAGEIIDAWPNKSVTIVHNQSLLTNSTYPKGFRLNLERRLRQRGVNVILGDQIGNDIHSYTPLKASVVTKNGVIIKCDLVIPARGGRPNTAFMTSLDPNPLNDKGFVQVTPAFQVQCHPNIFAAGDILDWPEVKQFAKISTAHVPVAANNILAFLEGRPLPKRYKGFWDVLVTTIGKDGGATYFGILGGIVFGNFITKFLKSKDLLVPRQRKELGLK